MISEFFNTKLQETAAKEKVIALIKQRLSHETDSVKQKLKTGDLILFQKRKKFLKHLKRDEVSVEKKHDKVAREEYFKEHQKKVDETKEFTKKLITERMMREKRQQEKDEQARIKAMHDMEEQKRRQEEIQKKLEEDKQKRLVDMLQKAEVRKKQIEGLKEQISARKPSQKPLYKQMEDAFQQQVLMPSLEQQKAELAKKRILYQPINPDEIKEHSKRHEELRREQEYKRKKELEQRHLEAQVNLASNNLHSKFTFAVLEEDRLKKDEKLKQDQERKANIQKKNQYAKLVKEMFPPIVNESKKLDIDSKKHSHQAIRSAHSGQHSRNHSLAIIKPRPGDYKSEFGEGKIAKRVWKENKMIKKPEPKKSPKTIDYLQERRALNKEHHSEIEPIHIDLQKEVYDEDFDEEKVNRIKAKAEKMEKLAQKQERMLGIGSVDSIKSLQVGDQVNDMILSSIKTKLALLDKINARA